MQNQNKFTPYARYNTFHGPKRQVLGNHAGHAPPAWKTNIPVAPGQMGLISAKVKSTHESGSRIFLSRLPADVGEKEVEELFRKTVGPLKDSFLVYNSQGKSKGMAVVTFQRPGDAVTARAKYDGKIVDGRRPIKIEILVDGAPSLPAPAPHFPTPPTLLDRIAPSQSQMSAPPAINGHVSLPPSAPRPPPRKVNSSQITAPAPVQLNPIPIPPRRFRQKKGPKRLKKRTAVTIADLDQEMEDYRAAAPEL
ncbi:hypothetical protein GALMADRAFT_136864 [Galerina marginata CBS 339.88]|uniref:RRM domain-containing protein n=1 Tax=Galerina marginata (strain CBS 339.88) TaxID=685588 RepID=A0A067TN44_GALM3|nr:hypothetical protein GALMADRAFT_136864 [Galerina marginata CBS 339.88]